MVLISGRGGDLFVRISSGWEMRYQAITELGGVLSLVGNCVWLLLVRRERNLLLRYILGLWCDMELEVVCGGQYGASCLL